MRLVIWQTATICVMCVVLVLSAIRDGAADEPAPKREWNQDEALTRVQEVLEIEKSGDLPWDNIAWETDAAKAIERSTKENKPLFVYMFLKKDIGPANAPC